MTFYLLYTQLTVFFSDQVLSCEILYLKSVNEDCATQLEGSHKLIYFNISKFKKSQFFTSFIFEFSPPKESYVLSLTHTISNMRL